MHHVELRPLCHPLRKGRPHNLNRLHVERFPQVRCEADQVEVPLQVVHAVVQRAPPRLLRRVRALHRLLEHLNRIPQVLHPLARVDGNVGRGFGVAAVLKGTHKGRDAAVLAATVRRALRHALALKRIRKQPVAVFPRDAQHHHDAHHHPRRRAAAAHLAVEHKAHTARRRLEHRLAYVWEQRLDEHVEVFVLGAHFVRDGDAVELDARAAAAVTVVEAADGAHAVLGDLLPDAAQLARPALVVKQHVAVALAGLLEDVVAEPLFDAFDTLRLDAGDLDVDVRRLEVAEHKRSVVHEHDGLLTQVDPHHVPGHRELTHELCLFGLLLRQQPHEAVARPQTFVLGAEGGRR
eukprot:PhM_4_TR1995/c0_g1_i1/m.8968